MCKINGKKLAELRKETGISLKEVAKGAGVSTSAITAYERNEYDPKDETVDKICLVLNVNKDDIIIHDVGYSFTDRRGKTENSLRNKKGFKHYYTPIEIEKFIAERRTMSEKEEKQEVSMCLKNSFGIGSKKYILIDPTLIHVPDWQRDTDMTKTREISDNFVEEKFEPIKVYVINKKLYVADGAHRLVAFVINGEVKILVEVLNCSEHKAILIFLGQQTGRKNMSTSDTYRAGIKANIEEYINFKYLFEEYGIQITADYKQIDNPIGYIRPSAEIMRMSQNNSDIITSIITLVKRLNWCGTEKNVFVLRTFKVIKKLYAAYGKETVEEKLMARCNGATYYESIVAPVKSNAELYDILAKEIIA